MAIAQDCIIKEATQQARVTERQYHSKQSTEYKTKIGHLNLQLITLTDRTHAAERKQRVAEKQQHQSMQRSKEVLIHLACLKDRIQELEDELSSMRIRNTDLEQEIHNLQLDLTIASSAIPIKIVGKVREGRGGQARWPHYMWEIIMEQLINGTPPSSVNENIFAMLKTFSPSIEIKELPSIWTIRRARTVLLVIVQVLATYRIGKANKWVQLFTDGTSRRQNAFQDLIISIEEDDMFR